jgi:uncharacterized caspase-like protein
VVGNAAYSEGIPVLANPANDASDIAAVLSRVGWRVTRLVDANRRDFNRNINLIRDALKGNPGSTALFYYAGHGLQIEGKNYMLPIDQVFETNDDVKLSAVSVVTIVQAFSVGRTKFSLIILDSFYRFLPIGDNENDNGTMAQVYNHIDRFAARLGCAFVLVHHASKGMQSGKAVTDVGAGAGDRGVLKDRPGLSDVMARSGEGRDESRPYLKPSPAR